MGKLKVHSSWSRGFEAAEKSFALIRKDKIALIYAILVGLITAPILLSFSTAALLLPLVSIPLIYRTALSLKKPIPLSIISIVWLLVCFLIEFGLFFLINTYVPENKESWLSAKSVLSFVWSAATFYVLPAIIIDSLNPLKAFIQSNRGIMATWLEAAGFELWFAILTFFIFVPFMIIGIIASSSSLSKETLFIIQAVTIAIAGTFAVIKIIGRTLLYLYYKKELPTSYFEK